MDVQGLIAHIQEWEQAYEQYLQTRDQSLMERVGSGIDQLCDHYLLASPAEREQIRQAFDGKRNLRNVLIGHIYRAASRIKSDENSHWLLVGLAAASIDDTRTDFRDVYVALGELYLAAVRAGIDCVPHFKKVARLSSGKAHEGRNTRHFIGGFRQSAYFKQSVAARLEFATGKPGFPPALPAISAGNASHLMQLDGIGFSPGMVDQPMVWSPDGLLLAMAQGTTVALYTMENLQAPPRVLRSGPHRDWEVDHLVTGLAFDASGQLLASSPGATKTDIVVWDVTSSTEQRIIQSPVAVHALAFSPQGVLLASGGRA